MAEPAPRPGHGSRQPPLAGLVAADLACIGAALWAAQAVAGLPLLAPLWASLGPAFAPVAREPLLPAVLAFQALAVPFGLAAFGQYRLTPEGGWSFPRIVLALSLVDIGLSAFLAAVPGAGVPGALILPGFVVLLALLPAWRWALVEAARRRLRRGERTRHALFVGAGPLTQAVALEMVREPLHGRRVVGFLTDEPGRRLQPLPPDLPPGEAWMPEGGAASVALTVAENALRHPRHLFAPVLVEDLDTLGKAVDGLGAEEIFVAPDVPAEMVGAVLRVGQERGLDIHLIPDHREDLGIRPHPWALGPFTLMDVHRSPFSRLGRIAKRTLDVGAAAAGLVLASPILLATALCIKLETPRLPVLYRSVRVGQKGRRFWMAKFTTMVPDAQRLEASLQDRNTRQGPWFKLDGPDPRLTKVGRWVRKLSINELPQLWNVLVGDMSMVGPRPPLPAEVASYLDYDSRYFRCLDVKPGLTGLWQVTARNDPSFDRRVELDLEYIQRWSFGLDLLILLKTVKTVLTEHES